MTGEFGTLMGWANSAASSGCASMPTRRRMREPPSSSAPRASGFAAPSTCSSRRPRDSHRARDDPRRGRAGAPRALAKLLPMQRADFVELFEIMKGLPVTIRLLDPPLHEFLPHTQAEIEEVARAMNADPRRLARSRPRSLHEFNPMLGLRGCRLAIAYPEIAEMQARAIFEAAVEAGKRDRQGRRPRGDDAADRDQAGVRSGQGADRATAQSVMKETGSKLGLSDRHHDRTAARVPDGRRYRADGASSSPSAPTT